MKNIGTKIIVTASVFLFIGIIICVGVLASVNFNFNALLTTSRYEKKEQTFDISATDTLNVNLSTHDIALGVSPDNKLHFTYFESEFEKYSIFQTEGTLDIKFALAKKPFLEYLKISLFEDVQAELLIPASFKGSLMLHVSTGKISADRLENINDLQLSSSTGALTFNTLSASNISVTTSTGDIQAATIISQGECNIKTSTGDIKLDKITAKTVNLNATTGSNVSTTSITAETITIKSTTGKVSIASLVAKKVNIDTNTGNINFDILDADNSTLKATTGYIKGTVKGAYKDYSITSKTSTGKNNLPDHTTSGVKVLNVSTKTGNVDIKFSM